jgi:hypothetical protein
MAYSTLENGLKVQNHDQNVLIFWSRMNKLVYIYVPNEFVIGYVLFILLIKRLAVAMVNKTVDGVLQLLNYFTPSNSLGVFSECIEQILNFSL